MRRGLFSLVRSMNDGVNHLLLGVEFVISDLMDMIYVIEAVIAV